MTQIQNASVSVMICDKMSKSKYRYVSFLQLGLGVYDALVSFNRMLKGNTLTFQQLNIMLNAKL